MLHEASFRSDTSDVDLSFGGPAQLTDTGLKKARRQIADVADVLSWSMKTELAPEAARKLRQAAAFLGVALDLLDELPPLQPIDVS